VSRKSPARPVLRLVPSATPGTAKIRVARVRTAQARIVADYYDRPLVKERILDAVLEELERR
jgi:hypothetical protein